MVSSNKLYEPILGEGEAAIWGNIYANNSNQNSKNKKKGGLLASKNNNQLSVGNTNSVADPTTPSIFNFKPILVPIEHVEHFKNLDDIGFDIFTYHEKL